MQRVRHWFLDLDGTVYLGNTLIPGALEFIRYLETQGASYTFLTNNSSKSAHEYLHKLRSLGFPVDERHIFTSGQATARHLARARPEARVYVLGTPALAAELGAQGVAVTDTEADTVVVGYDTTLSYPRLAQVCHLLRAGAHYVVTHPDVNCPSPEGPLPDAGAFMALLHAATGREPDLIVGKPNVDFLREAAAQAGVPLEHCAMVGDRLETDMDMACRAGIPAVLVMSGVTDADDSRLGRDPFTNVRSVRDLADLHATLAMQ